MISDSHKDIDDIDKNISYLHIPKEHPQGIQWNELALLEVTPVSSAYQVQTMLMFKYSDIPFFRVVDMMYEYDFVLPKLAMVDVIDNILPCNCSLTMNIGGKIIELTSQTIIPICAIVYSHIKFTATFPNTMYPPSNFGLSLRCTVLPTDERSNLLQYDEYRYNEWSSIIPRLPRDNADVLSGSSITEWIDKYYKTDITHRVYTKNVFAKMSKENSYTIELPRSVHVIDHISAINCEISLKIGNEVIKLKDNDVIPIALFVWQTVYMTMTCPNDNEWSIVDWNYGRFGYTARYTMLPLNDYRELVKPGTVLNCNDRIFKDNDVTNLKSNGV